jgi:hypothetical protein
MSGAAAGVFTGLCSGRWFRKFLLNLAKPTQANRKTSEKDSPDIKV